MLNDFNYIRLGLIMIQGYDISAFQGDTPQSFFDNLKSTNQFVIIKVNDGTPDATSDYIDTQFKNNQSKARSANCIRGYYHVCYPTLNSASAEASYFVSLLSDIQEGEILALDFEPIGNNLFKNADGSYAQSNVEWVLAWLSAVSSALNGIKPLVYMDASILNSMDWSSVANAGYGLWLAEYSGNPNDIIGLKYWSFMAFSQFSDQALVDGISGRVDQDAFYGSAEDFIKYGYVPLVVTPTPTVETTTTSDATPTVDTTPTTSQSTDTKDTATVSDPTPVVDKTVTDTVSTTPSPSAKVATPISTTVEEDTTPSKVSISTGGFKFHLLDTHKIKLNGLVLEFRNGILYVEKEVEEEISKVEKLSFWQKLFR